MRLLVILAISLVVTVLLILTRPEPKAELQPYPAPVVTTTTVAQEDVQPIAVKTGLLQPARKARLRFEVSGRVIERRVEPGQHVAEGDILLRLDAGDYVDALQEAEARVQQERQAVARDLRLLELVKRERRLQEREVERLEKLGRESLSSQSARDEAVRRLLQYEAEAARLRYSVDTAEARLQSRLASLNRARRNVERSTLQAPFETTVNAVELEVGDYVSAGQVAVELVQLDKLDLYLEIISELAATLELGQRVTIQVRGAEREGEIVALSADPDPDTHTHPMRVRLDRDGLLPGMVARVELPEPFITDALTVPVTSVLQESGNAYVFKVDDQQLVRTLVSLSKRFQDRWIIGGMAPGTTIVSDDVGALTDGQKINLRSRQ